MSYLIESANLWLPWLCAMLGLVFASGFFSSSETALFYLSHDELRAFRIGKSSERLVARLLLDPDRLLTAVLFWNLVINLTYFAVSVVVTRRLAAGGHPALAGGFGLASLIGVILFGEVLPKSLAVVFRKRLASLVGIPLAVAVRVVDPIAPYFRQATTLARHVFWPDIKREPLLDSADLERAVEASELKDDVIRFERQILHNVLGLSELTAEEVMRPRGTYDTHQEPVSLADLNREVPSGDYVLISNGQTDEIERAVPLASFSAVPEHHLEQSAEEVVIVPWCATLAYTLQLMRDRFSTIASVINEYGDTIGIVTYDDIIDTVFVPEPSRARRLLQREPVLEIAPGRYHVEGITTLRYLSKRLKINYQPTAESLVTLAGMLHEELQRIPQTGDECYWQGFRIKVIDVPRPGQLRAMVMTDE